MTPNTAHTATAPFVGSKFAVTSRACQLAKNGCDKPRFEQAALWTCAQRIRTVAEMPLALALVDAAPLPKYQAIAAKALHLSELGLSQAAIARRLAVTGKTAKKAIGWAYTSKTREHGRGEGSAE
jgi:hypothetical protein